MGRRATLAAVLVGVLGWAPAVARAQDAPPDAGAEVAVADLLADPAAYAGAALRVRGELIGDFGRRGDGSVWTQLNGDAYVEAPLQAGGSLAGANLGIGVHVPAGVWPGLEGAGGYRMRGPLVELSGVWRFHDPARGGESYLEVSGMAVLAPAQPLEDPVGWVALGLGAGLLGLAGAVLVVLRRRGGTRPAGL